MVRLLKSNVHSMNSLKSYIIDIIVLYARSYKCQ